MIATAIQSFFGMLRRRRLTAAFGRVCLAGIALFGVWLVQRGPAQAAAQPGEDELDAAIRATLEAVVANSASPKDLEKLQEAVTVAFPLYYPELALRENPKPPERLQAEAEPAQRILNAGAIEAELMKDDAYRRQREEALQSLGHDFNPDAKRQAIEARVRALHPEAFE